MTKEFRKPLGPAAQDVSGDRGSMTPVEAEGLFNLVNLAHNRAGKARATLVRRLTDLALLPDGHLMPQERALVHEILTQLAVHIEFDLRVRLARRLARAAEAPADLVVMLARDAIEIAQPLLEQSDALCDADLICIARDCTPDHRHAMAGRMRLSTVVTDALMAEGETEVMARLAANPGARLSRAGFDTLIRYSEGMETLQRTLLDRTDITPVLAHTMFWNTSSNLRRQIIKRFSVDRRLLRAALEDAIAEGIEEFAGDSGLSRTLEMMRGRRDRMTYGQSAGSDLLAAARNRDLREMARRLARLAAIRPRTAARIVSDAGGEALAVACKALGLSQREFLQLCLLVEACGGHQPGDADRLTALFDSVATDSADVVLRYWDEILGADALKGEVLPGGRIRLQRGQDASLAVC